MEIKRLKQKADGTKYLIIPKGSNLKKGDWVKITKLREDKDEQ